MNTFTCPTTGLTVPIEPERLLSSHRTATGRISYTRCPCGGMVVLSGASGDPLRPVSHSPGRQAAVAKSA